MTNYSVFPTSYLSDKPTRKAETEAEQQLLTVLWAISDVYEVTRIDRIALSRAIIAALEAAKVEGARG